MSSIDRKELFEQYYQREYDFNTISLSQDEIRDIKRLVKEKRWDYALAPMGTGIFDWIRKQNGSIRFEMVAFDSEKIDGMLYIPTVGKERVYIILNSEKPLINQIFTAAHEYYHYMKDYQRFKNAPSICDFSMLRDVNEKCASRFAAEFLLPAEALTREIAEYLRIMNLPSVKAMDFNNYAILILYLTVQYQMPLKAVIYRLVEEQYIDEIDRYIENYDFIKRVLQEIKLFKGRVDELYGKENKYVISCDSTYSDMEKAFWDGNASRSDILRDAETLHLDMDLINDFLGKEEMEEDDADEDEELFSMIRAKRSEYSDNTA